MKLQEMYAKKSVKIDNMAYILIDYDLFFSEELGKYTFFSIDDEYELAKIEEVCRKLIQLGAEIYVFAYNENQNSIGENYIYADCLWVDTTLSIKDLYTFFAKYKLIEPSDISLIKETGEYTLSNLLLFKSTGEIIEFKEVVDGIRLDNMKSLYWD